jgi:hypothetical protein
VLLVAAAYLARTALADPARRLGGAARDLAGRAWGALRWALPALGLCGTPGPWKLFNSLPPRLDYFNGAGSRGRTPPNVAKRTAPDDAPFGVRVEVASSQPGRSHVDKFSSVRPVRCGAEFWPYKAVTSE